VYVNRQTKVDSPLDNAVPTSVQVTVMDARKRDADA